MVAGRIDLASKSGMRENGQKPVPVSRLEVTMAWSWLVTVETVRKVEFWVYFEGRADRTCWWLRCMIGRVERNERWLLGFWPEQVDITSFEAPIIQEMIGGMAITRACSLCDHSWSLHGVHLFVWLSVCMLALTFKTREKLVEKCSINAESQPHSFLWFSPLWLFFQYLLNLFFLPPLFAPQFRLLAWTVAIARAYPHGSGPLSILTLWQKNFCKIQTRSWLLPAKKYLPTESRSNSAVCIVKPSQVWLLLPDLALPSSQAAVQPSQLFLMQHPGLTRPFLWLEHPFPLMVLDKTPLNYPLLCDTLPVFPAKPLHSFLPALGSTLLSMYY